MCIDCGCSDTSDTHTHSHSHDHIEGNTDNVREISLKENILAKNNQIAFHNRKHFQRNRIFCLNWISAPGSGKTSLLEKIILEFGLEKEIFVIEGDQQTDNDSQRIVKAGGQAFQINTGSACHLDAQMIHQALHKIEIKPSSLLIIENVGNMVCPTAYDLGENMKVAVISCPEGEDKPIKYPDLLLTATVLLINKIDLIPYLDFDLEKCRQLATKVNPQLKIFPVSAKTGEGLGEFIYWLKKYQESPLT